MTEKETYDPVHMEGPGVDAWKAQREGDGLTVEQVEHLARTVQDRMPLSWHEMTLLCDMARQVPELLTRLERRSEWSDALADKNDEQSHQLATATAQVEQMRETLELIDCKVHVGLNAFKRDGKHGALLSMLTIISDALSTVPSTNYEEKIKGEVLRDLLAWYEEKECPLTCLSIRDFATEHNIPIDADKEGE